MQQLGVAGRTAATPGTKEELKGMLADARCPDSIQNFPEDHEVMAFLLGRGEDDSGEFYVEGFEGRDCEGGHEWTLPSRISNVPITPAAPTLQITASHEISKLSVTNDANSCVHPRPLASHG